MATFPPLRPAWIAPNPTIVYQHPPQMTFNIPAPAFDLPIALGLLDELELISAQALPVATALRQLNLDPAALEQMQPGADATAQRIICRLETAAEILRGSLIPLIGSVPS
jgi:hypothetical protein